MCTNSRYVLNKYTRKRILVPCGKCDSCKQEKAAAYASRIRNASLKGFVPVMVTLTYSNDFVPYVYLDDLNKLDIPVYRDYVIDTKFGVRSKVRTDSPEITVYNELYFDDDSPHDLRKGCKCLKHTHDRVGVLLFKDFQDFFKRLRLVLKRKYNYENKVIYWICTEYGSKSLRPHAHFICYVRSDSVKSFRSAVIESWSFSDWSRPSKSIQIARNAASYVASYVNRGACFPKVLENSVFAPKHSMSKGFGCDVDFFNLPSLLVKVKQSDLRYYITSFHDGERINTPVLVPKYVVNRYFPRFKGDSYLLNDEIREFLFVPERVRFIIRSRNRLVAWNADDTHRISVMLQNSLLRFADLLNMDYDDAYYVYPFYYVDVWSCYHSNLLKFSYDRITCIDDYQNFYENANILSSKYFVSDLQLLHDMDYQLDPNKRTDIVDKSVRMSLIYDQMSKYKDVNNLAMSNLHDDF